MSIDDAYDDDDDDDEMGIELRPRAYVLSTERGDAIVRNAMDNASSSAAEDTDAASSSSRLFVYDRVYGERSSTLQIYEEVVADIVESVGRQGRNGTVFTYGQTSTGESVNFATCG
jgi:hypothetical protein